MKKKNVQNFSAAGVLPHKTICYVAGRSGGHIVPALTLAQEHLVSHPNDHIVFISTNTKLDTDIVQAAQHVRTKMYLNLGNVPRSLLAKPLFVIQFLVAFFKSLFFLRKHHVSDVISMGGYISIPVCLAARLLRIPVTLYELNAEPGRAALFLAPYTTSVRVVFQKARHFFPGAELVAYPLRYKQLPAPEQVEHQMRIHGLDPAKKTLLVLGGSQGSAFLNKIVSSWFEAVPEIKNQVQVVHQTGALDSCNWRQWYHERGVTAVAFPFVDDLSIWYAAADLVVCRAGAGTLFEVAFFKKPCLIIPLVTAATSHQVDNARAMVTAQSEFFSMLSQSEIEEDPGVLFKQLESLLS